MIRKLYLIILMALMAMTGFAQETGDVIYVYQKDGRIDAFLRSEITEFYYGFEDEDGVTHDDLQMQWIVLSDSICKIPLANIDSISFVTPPTVYQPGVTVIGQSLMQYVESSDSLTIQFAANTPANLLPKVGDLLATTEMSDKFPIGFMGKVKKVTGTTIECDAVDYEDVLDTYYGVTVTEAAAEDTNAARRRGINWSGETRFTLPTWNFDFTPEFKTKITGMDDLAIKGGIKAVLSITPEFYIKSSLIVNKEQGFNFSTDIIDNVAYEGTLGVYGGLEYNHDFKMPNETAKVPIGYGVCLYIDIGAFVRASATVSMSGVWKQNIREQLSFRIGSKYKGEPIQSYDKRETSSSFDVKGCIDGSLMGGFFAELGLTFLHRSLDKLALRGEAGIEAAGHFVFLNSEIAKARNQTKYYEMLKASEIDLNFFANATIQAEVGQLNYTQNTPFNMTWPIAKWNLVPSFYQTEFEQCYSPRNAAEARVRASGNLIDDVNIGFKVYTVKGEEVGTYVFDDYYKKGDQQFGNRFEGLDMSEDYEVYPVVRINDGADILASPSVKLEKNPFPVTITNFEQTGSHYSKQQGYEYDGRNYFYKFNATTTVELSDAAENVKDWGYIYHDIYGVDKKISCANLGGRTYPDERYAYYCNDPQRTVELYPYVQFEGETEFQAGKHKIFPVEYKHGLTLSCPDENHPHAIDLGLPSGTKWACCNVGAETPVDFGKYYRWGEVKEVDGSEYPEYLKDLPTANIAGTTYDAAVINWGGGWNMPSVAQFNELDSNSSIERIYLEETGGLRFIGPNGNSIFLPAAGAFESNGRDYYKKPTEIDSSSSNQTSYTHNGLYWMQTGVWGDADDYQFDYSYIFYHDDNRLYKWNFPKTAHIHRITNASYAMPVRPVLKKKE